MPVLELTTRIRAPIERCFDLARSIDLHRSSAVGTDELAIAGVTRGLIGFGEQVTWRARHFGITQDLTSRITAFDRPHHFRDSMVAGAFRRFDHDHHFTRDGEHTVMRDRFDFEAPFGPFGWLFARLVLVGYLRRFLQVRNATLRQVAESGRWREFLPN